jgi:hypothetical protein
MSHPSAIDAAAILDAACPLDAPVLIQSATMAGEWGHSRYSRTLGQYVIELNSSIREPEFRNSVLVHEWAHCRTECNCADEHCSHWGVEYAKCYSAYVSGASRNTGVLL